MQAACGPGRLGHAETYRAEIHYQGGQHLYTRVDGLVGVTWGRKLDDFSEASITVSKSRAGADCCGKLGNIHPWGHELTLSRDDQLVWQGPCMLPSEFRDRFEIPARDMLAWLDRRRNPEVYNWADPSTDNPNPTPPADAQTIIDILVRDAFAEHDPGFLRSPTGGYQSGHPAGALATYQALQIRDSVIGDGVRDLIEHGIDMYTVGRHIMFLPERIARSNKPHRLTEDDFLGDLEVRRLGLDTATRGVVVGSQPRNPPTLSGSQPPPNTPPPVGVHPDPPAGVDGFYGLIEHGHTSNTATTQTAVDNLAELVRSYGYPAPLAVIVPSSTQLSPNAPITIRELVPGRVVQVHLTSYCTPVQQDFVINEVEVTVEVSDNGMTEQVQLSLGSKGSATQSPTQ